MSEDEIIKVITYKLNMKNTDVYAPILYDEIQSLLNLYNKEKEIIKVRNANIKLLLEGYSKIAKELNIKSFAINENIVINHVKENYISKDKIREFIDNETHKGTYEFKSISAKRLKELLEGKNE